MASDRNDNNGRYSRLAAACLVVILCVGIPSALLAQKNDPSGAELIFEYLGQELPAGWYGWDRSQRHGYLQSMEVYPAEDGKYSGKVRDLDGYFNWLGAEEPEGWDSLTFAERRDFVDAALEREPVPVESSAAPSVSPAATDDATPMKTILLIIGIIIGFGLMIASYGVDRLRSRR